MKYHLFKDKLKDFEKKEIKIDKNEEINDNKINLINENVINEEKNLNKNLIFNFLFM